jgi:ABC-type glycerol-3-phosphate transport system substrate-binding protein
MKKFSLFQIILLAVFGGLAAGGVLIFAIATGSNGSKSLGPVAIWGTLDSQAVKTTLTNLAQDDSNLSQVTYAYKDPTTYQQDLTNAFASAAGPDLFILRQDYAYQDRGQVAPIPYSTLSQSQFQNTFVDSANPYLSGDGVLAIPLLVDPMVLYWNKDVLAANGFAQPPQYWDELFNMASKITKRTDSGGITKSAIAFGEYDNIANAKDILALLILQTGGTITKVDQDGILQSALGQNGSAQNTASALRFYTEFANPSKDDYSWNKSLPDAARAFGSGDLALYVGYASEAAHIHKLNPNLNFAIAPVPQIRGGGPALNVAHIYGLAVSKTGKRQGAALSVAYLLAAQKPSAAFASALGLASARRDILAAPAQDLVDLFNKQSLTAHSWIDPWPDKTATIFRDMIEDTTSGTLSITDAVSRAEQQLATLLAPHD